MAIAVINWNPTEKVLRQFGWISLVGFPLIGWAFSGWFTKAGRPWSFDNLDAWTPTLIGLAIGLTLAIAGVVYPKAVKPAFVGLSLITFPIGLIVGELFLMTVFYLLFAFVSLIFKIVGYDPMTRAYDPNAPSYWQPKPQAANAKQYFAQY